MKAVSNGILGNVHASGAPNFLVLPGAPLFYLRWQFPYYKFQILECL